MAHPEFTLLGDAVWLDFVNSARGRTPAPPDLLPDAAAFTRWAHAQRLMQLDGGPPYPVSQRAPAAAHRAGRSPGTRTSSRPPAPSPPSTRMLASSTGSHRLTRVSGEWRLQFAPTKRAGAARGDRTLRRHHPGRPRGRRPALRRRDLLALLRRCLAHPEPALVHSRHLRHHPASRAAPGSAPLTGPDPRVAFERTREALGAALSAGAHRRLLGRAGALRGPRRGSEASGRACGSTSISTTPSAPGSCASRRRWASSTTPGSCTSTTRAGSAISPTGSGNWVDGEGLREAVRRGPRPIPTVFALARDLLGALEHAHLHGIIVRAVSPLSVLVSAGGRATVTDLRYCSYCLPAVPPGASPPALSVHGAGDPRRGGGRSRLGHLHRRGDALLRRHRTGARARPAADPPPDRAATHLPPGHRADRAAGAPARARVALLHRRRDAGGLRLGRRDLRRGTAHPGRRGGLAQRGSGPVGEAASAGAGRRLRAARAARHRRVRPGLPGARPSARTAGRAQGAAPVADPGSQRGGALPPRSAARRQARSSQHREHLRHRRHGRA